jgi:negative regulator of sigma E activity
MALKVSQLLDGQLDDRLVKVVLDEIVADPELRDRYTVYGLIGDALRSNSTPDDGFTYRTIERMRRENVMIEAGYDPLAEGEPSD